MNRSDENGDLVAGPDSGIPGIDALSHGGEDGDAPSPVRKEIPLEDFLKTLDFKKIWRGFRRSQWIILACVVFFGALGLFAGRKLGGKAYRSTAVLLYTSMPGELIGGERNLPIQVLTKQTAIEMIQLPQTLSVVEEELGFSDRNIEIATRIEVESDKRDDLVRLMAEAPTEKEAIAMVNSLARAVVRANAQWYRAQLTKMEERVRSRIRTDSQLLDKLESEKAQLAMEDTVFDPQSEYMAHLERVGSARLALEQQQALLEGLTVRIERLQEQLPVLPAEIVSTAYEDNPLKRRLANTEVALMEARTKYGPENPNTLMIEEEIKQLRRMLDEGTFDSNREQVFVKNPLRDQLEVELIRLRADEHAARSMLGHMQASMDALQQKSLDLPMKLRKFSEYTDQIRALKAGLQAQKSLLADISFYSMQALGDFSELVPGTKAELELSRLALLVKLFGFVFGLGLSLGVVLLYQVLDDRLVTARQVSAYYDMPPAVLVPDYGRGAGMDPELVRLHVGRSWMSFTERLAIASGEGRVIGYFSDEPGVGKSIITSILAGYYRANGLNVLRMDFDFFGGSLPPLADEPGLEQVVESGLPVESVIRSVAGGDEAVLQRPVSGLLEWVRSPAWQEICSSLKNRYDVVLLVGPPVNLDEAATVLARSCDFFVMVLGSGRTRRRELDPALEMLQQAGVRPGGFILNRLWPDLLDEPTRRRLASEGRGPVSFAAMAKRMRGRLGRPADKGGPHAG